MYDIQIHATRSSVCAGDDAYAPHPYTFTVLADAKLSDIYSHLASVNYLPTVAGKNHRWEAIIGEQSRAVFRGNSRSPEPSPLTDSKISELAEGGTLRLYFRYYSASN